jgi:hypothetical protein
LAFGREVVGVVEGGGGGGGGGGIQGYDSV